MNSARPDLSHLDPAVKAYVEALEAEIERLHQDPALTARRPRRSGEIRHAQVVDEDVLEDLPDEAEPSEPPTTLNIIVATASGLAKRTPRHLYTRQRRGGMGVFDLDSPEDEPPSVLAVADAAQNLLLITSAGRAFRMPVSAVPETAVRGHGESIVGRLNLLPDEGLAAILPDQAQGYVALLGQTGMVRLLRHHVFGEYMKPGAGLYDPKVFGPLASACWTPGEGDLFIATRQGRAIRFSEKSVPPTGGPGIRLSNGDQAVAITAVYPDSGVFLLGADGRGTVRTMEGFAPNKAPGAGGKIAMTTDHLVGAFTIDGLGDLFIISRLSKIIRFPAGDIPVKDGVVQGVICMALRADQPAAALFTPAFVGI